MTKSLKKIILKKDYNKFNDLPIELIHNGIDTKVFKPCDKKESRRKFGIPENVLVIGAVGHGGTIENQWKGGEYTRTALAAFMPKYPDCVFVNIGANCTKIFLTINLH